MSETTSSSFYAPGMMDLSRYRLERADLGPAWDAFVEGSPQGTLFSETRFLEALDGRPAVWWCLRSQEPAAAIALMESSDGRSAILYPNVIHNGIMLRAAPPSQSPAQVMSESFRILAYIATVLPDHY
ncbi:MAG: hypothetical protein CMM77_09105, partial [Rhodospirillaceae bacterium]|nr:hypothetical protein [Rhodospirillaceae bacterium]